MPADIFLTSILSDNTQYIIIEKVFAYVKFINKNVSKISYVRETAAHVLFNT